MKTGKFKIQQFNEGLGWVDIANGFETLVEAEKDMEENKNEYSCQGRHELRINQTIESEKL